MYAGQWRSVSRCVVHEVLRSRVFSNDLSFLHTRLRTATLRHDADGQATLLNLLLRNYLQYNLYDQAEKLVSKSVFPELANNNEWARYLYYTGQWKKHISYFYFLHLYCCLIHLNCVTLLCSCVFISLVFSAHRFSHVVDKHSCLLLVL